MFQLRRKARRHDALLKQSSGCAPERTSRCTPRHKRPTAREPSPAYVLGHEGLLATTIRQGGHECTVSGKVCSERPVKLSNQSGLSRGVQREQFCLRGFARTPRLGTICTATSPGDTRCVVPSTMQWRNYCYLGSTLATALILWYRLDRLTAVRPRTPSSAMASRRALPVQRTKHKQSAAIMAGQKGRGCPALRAAC